jgi:tRNA G37 N-methylase TrmD
MRIDIITVLPELLGSPFETSILKRAQDKPSFTRIKSEYSSIIENHASASALAFVCDSQA